MELRQDYVFDLKDRDSLSIVVCNHGDMVSMSRMDFTSGCGFRLDLRPSALPKLRELIHELEEVESAQRHARPDPLSQGVIDGEAKAQAREGGA